VELLQLNLQEDQYSNTFSLPVYGRISPEILKFPLMGIPPGWEPLV